MHMIATVFTQRDETKGVCHTETGLHFKVHMHETLLV